MDFAKEAQQVSEEVSYAVSGCWVSDRLESTREGAFLNITTREGEPYCVKLSWRGFQVVGRHHDEVSEEEETAWESVYSLLSHISPSYTTTFSRQLSEKLTR